MKETKYITIASDMPTQHIITTLQYVIRDGFNAVGADCRGNEVSITFERERDETKAEAIERFLKRNWVDIDRELGTDTWDNNVQPFVTALLEYLKGLPDE